MRRETDRAPSPPRCGVTVALALRACDYFETSATIADHVAAMASQASSMHPCHHAVATPDKAAIIMADTDETVTFAELDRRSNRMAQLFRSLGANTGDCIAVMMENCTRYFEVAWAAQRAGLYFTAISSKLIAAEASYILHDCGARIFITSVALRVEAAAIARGADATILLMDGLGTAAAGACYMDLDSALARHPSTPVADQSAGSDMLYSSGTTGRPKGIRMPMARDAIDAPTGLTVMAKEMFGFSEATVYLSPAPLYHAAPLRWSMMVHALGGTVIVMTKFDAEAALAAIERYRVTASQWVPTHFVRLLKLPHEVRQRSDLSSMTMVIHAAAPCPVPVKRMMMEWWGPIIHEYYGGSESFGSTKIGPEEWLARPGSVGRALSGTLWICDEDGEPVRAGIEGLVFFENDVHSEYNDDPEKTASTRNRYGWATYGDIGYVDAEGYLFLTDRKSFVIISGGVNIYPQEIENILYMHPKVADAAVIGAPDPEMGERVIAVIQPADWADANEELASELVRYVRRHLSGVKVPRQIDFMQELPRLPTGKLLKRILRDHYVNKAKDEA